jgi:hypothetical protein
MAIVAVAALPKDDTLDARSSALKEKALRLMSDESSSTGPRVDLLAPAPAAADEGL